MTRTPPAQAAHDHVVASLAAHYARQHEVWANPGNAHNRAFSNLYPDLIVHDKKGFFIFEVETADSITEEEAINEWAAFDHAWKVWYLLVPAADKARTIQLLASLGLHNCKVGTYADHEDGIPSFAGIP